MTDLSHATPEKLETLKTVVPVEQPRYDPDELVELEPDRIENTNRNTAHGPKETVDSIEGIRDSGELDLQDAPHEASDSIERPLYDPDELVEGKSDSEATLGTAEITKPRMPSEKKVIWHDAPDGNRLAVPKTDTEEGREVAKELREHRVLGIEYDKDGFPSFGPCALTKVDGISMKGPHYKVFNQADQALANQWNAKKHDSRSNWSASDVKAYRKEHGLTWHEHQDCDTCQLVPTKIHDYFRHTGGHSIANRMRDSANEGDRPNEQ